MPPTLMQEIYLITMTSYPTNNQRRSPSVPVPENVPENILGCGARDASLVWK